MSKEEEETEKSRVKSLTPFQKDQELRQLNRQIAKLEMLKGIHTGELYSWSGRYKQLARDYGMPMFAYYWVVWTSTAVVCYVGITVFQIDCMAVLAQLDGFTGWDITSKVDPEMGKIGMAILVNELLEPLRLPAVILTVKPVMDNLFPPKY
jgi:diphthamide synthase (EF-2-diphthine--ammonia ligase)